MSEELNRKQFQPIHALAYMTANFGKGGVPVYEFFANVFNMDEHETNRLLEDARVQPHEALAKQAHESLIKQLGAGLWQ